MIKYGFPDAVWIEGRRLHRSVASVNQTWVQATLETRAAALADAVGLTSSPDAPREKTMVFVNTAAAADEIAREFNVLNLSAAAFHADMPSHDRAMRLKDFADGALDALVCTDSAARGVDIPGVAHVVQAEFAGNAVDYLHRIGRTARGRVRSRHQHLSSRERGSRARGSRRRIPGRVHRIRLQSQAKLSQEAKEIRRFASRRRRSLPSQEERLDELS